MTQYNFACRTAAITLAAVLLGPMALAQPAGNTQAMPNHGTAKQSADGAMDMKSMMQNGAGKMQSMQMTGNVDLDFAMMMRMHHQGAIDMAEMELQKGKDAEMKSMAKMIIESQKKEIAKFDKFIAAKQMSEKK